MTRLKNSEPRKESMLPPNEKERAVAGDHGDSYNGHVLSTALDALRQLQAAAEYVQVKRKMTEALRLALLNLRAKIATANNLPPERLGTLYARYCYVLTQLRERYCQKLCIGVWRILFEM